MKLLEDKLKEALYANQLEISESGNIYFQTACELADKGTLNGCLEIENKEDINKFNSEHLKKIISNIAEWDAKGRQLLKQEFPDEDENEPPLNDIIIYPDGSFSIGYDTGESAAGQLYLYVNYSGNFERNEELIYEAY